MLAGAPSGSARIQQYQYVSKKWDTLQFYEIVMLFAETVPQRRADFGDSRGLSLRPARGRWPRETPAGRAYAYLITDYGIVGRRLFRVERR